MRISDVKVVERGNVKNFNFINLGEVPTKPGAYCLLNQNKVVLKVGKSKDLRLRLNRHYNEKEFNARYYKWAQTNNEHDALLLEAYWRKKFKPVYDN